MQVKMANKRIFYGLTLLAVACFLSCAGAQGSDLCDWQYDLAEQAFASGDCKNASVHLAISFDRCTAIGNMAAIEKCNKLILKVNDCLKTTGDSYYMQALNYYSAGDRYLTYADYSNARMQLDQAVNYLLLANATFNYMLPPDLGRIGNVNTKYTQVQERIAESELMKGRAFYKRAGELTIKGEYCSAYSFVENASVLCTENGDVECVEDSEKLRGVIVKGMGDAADRGRYLYDKAIELYNDGNCTNDGFFNSMKTLEEAKTNYLIGCDTENAQNAVFMINQTQIALGECKGEMATYVKDKILELRTRMVTVKNCSELMDIDYEAKALTGVADMFYKRFKDRAFKDLYDQCAKLVADIGVAKKKCENVLDAEGVYQQATAKSESAEYEESIVLAEQARKMFLESKDYGGVTKSERLIDELMIRLEKVNESNRILQTARDYESVADFENALTYAQLAKDSYSAIARAKDVAECDKLLTEISDGNATKNAAYIHYVEASRLLNMTQTMTARDEAQKARDMYLSINDSKGVSAVDALNIKEPQSPWSPLPFVIIAAVIIVFLAWMQKKNAKTQKEKAMTAEQLHAEEEKRRLQVEADSKRREAEKERMMQERKRIKDLLTTEKKVVKVDNVPEAEEPSFRPSEDMEKRMASIKELLAREKGGSEAPVQEAAPKAPAASLDLAAERAKLEALLSMESDSIKKEKTSMSDLFGSDRARKAAEALEKSGEDQKRIKDMVDGIKADDEEIKELLKRKSRGYKESEE